MTPARTPHGEGLDLPAGLVGQLPSTAPVGLLLTDGEGLIGWANQAFSRLIGYEPHELVGLSLGRLVAPELSVITLSAHLAFLRGDDRALQAGITLVHRNGRTILAHLADSRVEHAGRFYRLTAATDLSRMADHHWPGSAKPDPFSAMAPEISNDFNNVLSIVLGYTAMLQEHTENERIAVAVRGIEKAVARAATLIKQTLYLSRRTEPSFQRGRIAVWMDDFIQVLRDTAGGDIQLASSIDRSLPDVSLDPYQLNHILTTLVQRLHEVVGTRGAIHFRTALVPGHSVHEKFVDAREPSYVLIELQGRLPSLADAMVRERYTTAVERLAERRRDLALLVVHSIMAGHHGHFEAEAEAPDLFHFRLYLPPLPEPATPAPSAHEASAAPREQVVLLVDDEEGLLHALGYVLERNGCKVIKARDGVEAVEKYRMHRATIGLVLCDLGLPHMSGWEAVMKMREIEPRVDALFMSGHLEETLQNEILRAGAKGFLQKPFAMREVVAVVKRYFSGRADGSGGAAGVAGAAGSPAALSGSSASPVKR